MTTETLETVWAPRFLSVLRIVAALLFMQHGTQKLLGFPGDPDRYPEAVKKVRDSGKTPAETTPA